jgi:hypothetical protein
MIIIGILVLFTPSDPHKVLTFHEILATPPTCREVMVKHHVHGSRDLEKVLKSLKFQSCIFKALKVLNFTILEGKVLKRS